MRATRRGRRCSCGSDGCWELSVGQEALRDALGLAGPARPAALARAIADIAARRGTLPDAYVEDLATGVCTIVTMVDPRAVVFGGLFADVLGVPDVDAWGVVPQGDPPRRSLRSEAAWARRHLGPWVGRRLTGRSSGDGVVAKRPELTGWRQPPA